jgi:hypothetical protein
LGHGLSGGVNSEAKKLAKPRSCAKELIGLFKAFCR